MCASQLYEKVIGISKKVQLKIIKGSKFYCAEEKQPSTVKMMGKLDDYEYYLAKEFKCVKLDNEDDDFSMTIILPDKLFSLNDVIQRLDAKTIEDCKDSSSKFVYQYIDLKPPKYKVERDANLEGSLRLLGVEEAFDEEAANFS